VTQLLQAALQRGSAQCVVLLCKLTAAQQLGGEAVAQLLQPAESLAYED
jgi:hypothetical protein